MRDRRGPGGPELSRITRAAGSRGESHAATDDRIAVKYTGAPYPQRAGRVVFLIEPEHVQGTAYG
jgi:hypothetical protein